MAEIMNESLQKAFTQESEIQNHNCEREEGQTVRQGLFNLEVTVHEIGKIIENMDVRKASGPDGISNWIIKECKDQLVDKIHSVISSSMREGKVPRDWKRADIVLIFKGGK